MNLIDETFARLKNKEEKALIPYVTVGDPDMETSIDMIAALDRAGADLIELGVPYTDPLADGPVIQRSTVRALKKQAINVFDCIEAARQARQRGVTASLILCTYYNPVLQCGVESVFQALAEHGMNGIIIPDLPYEEDEPVRRLAMDHNIHLISLVAPTSKNRIQNIVSRASGFIYCVSSLGVTGERSGFSEEVDRFLSIVKEATSLPIVVGFGISNREHVARFAKICDGVIVGSALVRTIEDNLPLLADAKTKAEGLANVERFIQDLKAGTT